MKRLVLERTDGHHAYKRGVLILNGGKSSRMGQSKADSPWQGGTLLTHMLDRARLSDPNDIVISTNTPIDLRLLSGDLYESHPLSDRKGHKKLCNEELRAIDPHETHCLQWKVGESTPITMYVVADVGGSHGPLSGILSGLQEGRSEVYMTVSIDMPFFENFDFGTTCHMLDRLGEAPIDCVVPTLHSRIEPMGALYSKRCIEAIKQLLQQEEYHVRALFDLVKTEYIVVDDKALEYKNVNTPLEFKLARAKAENTKRKVPLISVCAAQSKTGKTTIATALIKALTKKGFDVGFVKSDGHGFTMDQEGSDTWQATEAGATAVAISGPTSYAMIVSHNKKKDIASLAENLSVDLVVLETRSRGVLPIIQVVPSFTDVATSVDSTDVPIKDTDVVAIVSMTEEAIPQQDGLCTRCYFTKSQVEALADWLCEEAI